MSLNVVLDAFASAELIKLEERFRQEGRAEVFLRAFNTALEDVRLFPEMMQQDQDTGARQIRIRGFPYSVVYLIDPDAIYVVAIKHERQDPGYWVDRLTP